MIGASFRESEGFRQRTVISVINNRDSGRAIEDRWVNIGTSHSLDLPAIRRMIIFGQIGNHEPDRNHGHAKCPILARCRGADEEILATAFNLAELRQLRMTGIYGRHHRQPGTYGPLMEK